VAQKVKGQRGYFSVSRFEDSRDTTIRLSLGSSEKIGAQAPALGFAEFPKPASRSHQSANSQPAITSAGPGPSAARVPRRGGIHRRADLRHQRTLYGASVRGVVKAASHAAGERLARLGWPDEAPAGADRLQNRRLADGLSGSRVTGRRP
jgi:hypothetical protein